MHTAIANIHRSHVIHPARGTNRKLRCLYAVHGLLHPFAQVRPWHTGREADARRRAQFADLVSSWCEAGKLACECCGRTGTTVGYAGHIASRSILCSGCVVGIECLIGACAPRPEPAR